jgi:two-component system, NtrC family, nitrogen regulation response regulator GlnG
MKPTVLIIDDEEAIAWALRKACEYQGYRAVVAPSAEEGLSKAETEHPAAIFLDVRLPGMDGLTALGQLRRSNPDAAILVMTAHGNLSTAVKAVEGGAFDYLAKPFDLDAAMNAVERAVKRGTKQAEIAGVPLIDDEIIGTSPAIQNVFKRIALVAPTSTCVLITGESGTGKELVARAIHANSPRRDKPFLPVHVAALNPNLVESELFGHVRGAFTGADRSRPGLLVLADGGTVFLDELGDIPLGVQVKLLRVLERQEILPVGGVESQRVNVRIVSATNANLTDAVAEGRFRADLFYRLNVYPIHLPALRDRPDDLPILAEHFLRLFGDKSLALSSEALRAIQTRSWPGNVRELKNALEHAAIQARGGIILPEHLPESVAGAELPKNKLAALVVDWVRQQVRLANGEPTDLHQQLLAEIEPALLQEVLGQLDSNRLAAGKWLGLARATVRKLIRKYQLEVADVIDDGDDLEG